MGLDRESLDQINAKAIHLNVSKYDYIVYQFQN